jgi:hypothetical protein
MGKSARLVNKLFAEAETVKAKMAAATEAFILIEVVGLVVIEKVGSRKRFEKKADGKNVLRQAKRMLRNE